MNSVRFLLNNVWRIIAPKVYKINVLFAGFLYKIIGKKIEDPFLIPIYINNYNHLKYLVDLIACLEKRGYRNIHIIDNDSTYKPLLIYYETCPYEVIKLGKNVGFTGIWDTGTYKKIWNSYYVYTDSDIFIEKDCPIDFMSHFVSVLEKYPLCHKVGFGLRIDDIPNYFTMKEQVIKHESQFWTKQIEPDLYDARIDTTFALYRPFCKGPSNSYKFVIRTGGKYVCKHQPWYVNINTSSVEDLYYIRSIQQSTHWSAKVKNM